MFLRKLFNLKNSFALIENKEVNIIKKTVNAYKTDKIAVNA